MKSITVLLPALNEEKAIGKVIQDIKNLPIDCDVLVVDNLSTNGTAVVSATLGVKVLYEKRRGKGNAVRTGFRHINTDYVVMIDADGTYPVFSIPLFYSYLEEYDVVKGSRRWVEAGAMTKTNRFGNWALSLLASILYGQKVEDVCSGLWVMRMDKVKGFNLVSNGFTFEADLFINTVKTGCKFKELPIEYRTRVDGSQSKLGIIDGVKIGWFLIRRRFSR